MIREFIATSLLLFGASALLADPATTQPAMPVSEIPVPPPRAAATPAATAPIVTNVLSGKVIVLPFEVLGDAGGRDWVGRAVQESLASEIAHLGGFSPVSLAATGPIDTATALDTAATAKADIVIFGDCQFDVTDIRFTGQIVDVSKGQAVAGLKASGNFRDLFALEDQLSAEVRHALKPPPPPVAGSPNPDDSMVFGKPAPELSTAALYQTANDAERFSSEYNHFYYAPAYEPFLLDDGGGYPFEGGYNAFSGGYYPFDFGGSVIVVSPRGGLGHGGYGNGHNGGGRPPGPRPRGIEGQTAAPQGIGPVGGPAFGGSTFGGAASGGASVGATHGR
jgi:TolB-like protein